MFRLMKRFGRRWFLVVMIAHGAAVCRPLSSSYTVASYNLQNYLLNSVDSRRAKSRESRAKVAAIIETIDADILCLQEVGGVAALDRLRSDLVSLGLTYPYAVLVEGPDRVIQTALLSRFPIISFVPHTRTGYLIGGEWRLVSRGFGEALLEINQDYRVRIFWAHLKSKREIYFPSQRTARVEEALALRRMVESYLKQDEKTRLLVVGDLNDHPESGSVRIVLGNGRWAFEDVAPEAHRAASDEFHRGNWTAYYSRDGSHNRFDYILASPGLKSQLDRDGCFIPMEADYSMASDHRPIVASFLIPSPDDSE